MTKVKSLILCALTAVLTVGLTVGVLDYNHKTNPTSLVITGPTMVNKGDIIDFTATVENPSWFLSSAIYQWKVVNKDGEVKYTPVGTNRILIPAGLNSDRIFIITSATTYHNYALWGAAQPLDIKLSTVNVGDPVPPNPGPGPVPPNPGPTPTPVVKEHLYAILIHDSTQDNNLTPEQLALKTSQTIQAKLKPLDTDWKIYDKANPALSDPKWQAAIAKAGLPGLFIVDKNGKQYNEGKEKLSTETDTVKQIQTLRGM